MCAVIREGTGAFPFLGLWQVILDCGHPVPELLVNTAKPCLVLKRSQIPLGQFTLSPEVVLEPLTSALATLVQEMEGGAHCQHPPGARENLNQTKAPVPSPQP